LLNSILKGGATGTIKVVQFETQKAKLERRLCGNENPSHTGRISRFQMIVGTCNHLKCCSKRLRERRSGTARRAGPRCGSSQQSREELLRNSLMNRQERRAVERQARNAPKVGGAGSSAALHQAGVAHFKMGRHLDAQASCARALAINPKNLGRFISWASCPCRRNNTPPRLSGSARPIGRTQGGLSP
jgi:hypothetical protein